jgi:thiamine pyrophosphate-dependent acetolactate synthase large subunit-like protein
MPPDTPTTVARYISAALAERGLTYVFMVTGGGAMFLNDALGNQSSQIDPAALLVEIDWTGRYWCRDAPA